MRLYDTARAGGRAVRRPAASSPCTRAASRPTTRPTSATPPTYLTYDVLQRRLRDLGHETRCVRNVTDVDDDSSRKARELGVHYLDLAAAEMARFDARHGGPRRRSPCFSEPRATSAIADIRGFIGMVLDRGHAYQAGGAVYFDVSTFPALRPGDPPRPRPRCSRSPPSAAATSTTPTSATRSTSCCGSPRPRRAGLGVAVGPGPARLAHRVLGALALRELGTTIDLHGGGHRPDLPPPRVRGGPVARRPPASPSCATGCTSGWSGTEGEKMSKSLGNLVFVSDLLQALRPARHPPGHHRPPLPPRRGSGRRRPIDGRRRPPRPLAGRRRGRRRARRGAGRPRRRPRHADGRRRHRRRRRRRHGVSQAAALLGVPSPDRAAGAGGARGSGAGGAAPATGARRRRRSCPARYPRSSHVRPAHRHAPRRLPRELPAGSTAADLAAAIGPRLAKAVVTATVDGAAATSPVRSRTAPPWSSSPTPPSDGRSVLRHSTAHVLAQAVLDLFPGAKFGIGPPIEQRLLLRLRAARRGHVHPTTTSARIEARMREIIAEDQPFDRGEPSRDEALALFADQPVQARDHRGGGAATPRRPTPARAAGSAPTGTRPRFVDLCRGPHVPRTSRLGHFKLLRVAGAYWRGDEKRPMLQRIYGTAWESARGAPGPPHDARGGREARPPPPRRGARPVPLRPGGRRRPRRCSTPRAAPCAG